MHLLYYTHNILQLGSLSPALSWAVIIGGVYGVFRLVWDVLSLMFRRGQEVDRRARQRTLK